MEATSWILIGEHRSAAARVQQKPYSAMSGLAATRLAGADEVIE